MITIYKDSFDNHIILETTDNWFRWGQWQSNMDCLVNAAMKNIFNGKVMAHSNFTPSNLEVIAEYESLDELFENNVEYLI
jgi:hypothetical protein